MATAKFDTLAAANELQAAGIADAHAEAMVSTARQAMTGLLTESRFEAAMDGVRAEFGVTNSRFDAAMEEMRAEFRVTNSRFDVAMEEMRAEFRVTNSRLEAAIGELRSDMEAGLAKQAAALETGLAKQASALDTGLARQTAALARFEGEIYRYLWVQGGSIIVILSSLYMLAESMFRA